MTISNIINSSMDSLVTIHTQALRRGLMPATIHNI